MSYSFAQDNFYGVIFAATENHTTSASYVSLGDEIANVVVPEPGLINLWYQATWQETVPDAARATIFIGSNQLKVAMFGVEAPMTTAATTNGAVANQNTPLVSCSLGLVAANNAPYTGDVTTGQVVGMAGLNAPSIELAGSVTTPGAFATGPCSIFALPGTYTVGVQFKTSSGQVSVLNRQLYVQVLS